VRQQASHDGALRALRRGVRCQIACRRLASSGVPAEITRGVAVASTGSNAPEAKLVVRKRQVILAIARPDLAFDLLVKRRVFLWAAARVRGLGGENRSVSGCSWGLHPRLDDVARVRGLR
jgi:hypothetical protein